MDFPSSVRVGPHTIAISLKPREEALTEEAWGCYNLETMTIWVQQELAPSKQARVLLHEIIHALWDVGELGEETDEETAVSVLSTQLLAAMHDNPGVFRWIVEQDPAILNPG